VSKLLLISAITKQLNKPAVQLVRDIEHRNKVRSSSYHRHQVICSAPIT